ncbi:ABC transporter substrate-binding protein [Paenibacillus piri]|uniref:Carbohydrate ABC transporter substrate-binding protein n=1 Tax=Paenibacillus piri TaxID=2547395 RepID=A0A4R5KKR5_9BACL|nr:ABC transporter substrate-binding protein [Paenibacillus piri]TDF95107.1 carbohydrate ABC transporter substrate-binding protein [Paenibacillus piri]
MNKRLHQTTSIIMLIPALLLGACSGGGGGNGTSNNTAPPADNSAAANKNATAPAAPKPEPKSDATITVGASQNWIKDVDRKLAEEFTKESGIKIDFQVNPDDQYKNVMKTKLATGEAPDIMYLNSGITLSDYQPEKNFLDLTKEPWVAKQRDWAIQGSTVDGKIYGFNTWSADGWAMLYNTKLFADNGLTAPKSFDELLKVCDVLLKKGITPIYDNTKDTWHVGQWFASMSYAFQQEDPGIFKKLNENQAKFSDLKSAKQGLVDYKTLYDKGYFGKNSLSNEWTRGYDAMGSQKYAMILVYTTYQNEVAAKFPESNAKDWKMFPVPIGGNTGFTYGPGIVRVVNKGTKHVPEIQKYYEFLSREKNLKSFYEARTDLGEMSFKDMEVRPPSNAYKSVTEMAGQSQSLSLTNTTKFIDGDLMGKLMQDMLIGQLKPEQVLQKFDESRIKSFTVAK